MRIYCKQYSKMAQIYTSSFIGEVLYSFSVIYTVEIQLPLLYSILNIVLVISTVLFADKLYLTIVTEPLNT